MPRESIILECTEAPKGKPPSRYLSTRNKKLQTDPVEEKYNRFMRKPLHGSRVKYFCIVLRETEKSENFHFQGKKLRSVNRDLLLP